MTLADQPGALSGEGRASDASSGAEDARGEGREITDPLTGLVLRGAFVRSVSDRIEGLAARSGKATLVYTDVDGLRAVNKSAGRARGDEVLVSVARAIAEALGEKTVIARDSGDSFAAFIPEMEMPFAAMAAEEVRARCSGALARVHGADAGGPPTVSVGFALFPDEGAEAGALVEGARSAARSAREAGGDCTASASSLGPLEGSELVLEGLPCPDFVGREEKAAAFLERLESCRRAGGYLFVRGEAGVGKTRLLREFRRAARKEGIAAGFAACRPTDPMRPFASLTRAFADLAGTGQEERRRLLEGRSPPEIEEIAALFERSGVPILPGPPRASPERSADERRSLVFRGLAGVLESLALGGMVVLLFDDAAWLDAATVDVLRSVASTESFGFLAVAAASDSALRDEGRRTSAPPRAGQLPPAAEFYDIPGPGLTAWEMPLRRLPLAAAAAMTSSVLAGRRQGEALDQALFGMSAGNPLFHEGLLRWLAIHRGVEGRGEALRLSLDPDSSPKTLSALLDATISALPGELAEAAAAAAAAGGPVSAAGLALALGRSEAEATGFIDWLLRLRLFEPASVGSDEMVPSSALTAERLTAAAEPDFLEVVHSAYADLAARRSAAGRESAAEEAYHRGLTSDSGAASRARALAEEEAARVWSGVEAARRGPPRADPAAASDVGAPAAVSARRETEPVPPPSAGSRSDSSVRKARFETPAVPAAPAPPAAEGEAPSRPEDRAIESLGPERILSVDGVPEGSDPIHLAGDDAAERLLAALDRLLDDNERPTAAAVVWRTLAAFEMESTQGRHRLAAFLAELEPRIWRTRLVESYKALEDTLARELDRETEAGTLELFARSGARAMHAFLRAGQYSRVERLGGRLMELSAPAREAAVDELSRTDFFDLILSDLASESAERSSGALAALRHVAGAVEGRLIEVVRASKDYRLRRMAAEALASDPGGGVTAIASLGPAASDEEHENVISVIDALGLAPEVAEDEVVRAINHISERVRRAGLAVAYRVPSGSAIWIIQRAINEGGTLGALRALQAVGELALVEAIPVVHRQVVETLDAAVVGAGVRALGRMAKNPDCPELKAVTLLARALGRLPGLPDKEAAERAALAALWALGQFDLPEATEAVGSAKSYPSVKVAAFASKMLERARGPE